MALALTSASIPYPSDDTEREPHYAVNSGADWCRR